MKTLHVVCTATVVCSWALALISLQHCTPAAQSRAACALSAAEALPLDSPDDLSLGDLKRLRTALRACKAGPDAGP